MSIRTPLARVRGSGSARSGTSHFWHQRLTAVANVPLVIAFVVILILFTLALSIVLKPRGRDVPTELSSREPASLVLEIHG